MTPYMPGLRSSVPARSTLLVKSRFPSNLGRFATDPAMRTGSDVAIRWAFTSLDLRSPSLALNPIPAMYRRRAAPES